MTSMSLARTHVRPFQAPARAQGHQRSTSVAVLSSHAAMPQMDRRSALGALAGLSLLLVGSSASAKNLQDAARAKEARKAQLAKAAQDMKQTGKTEAVFDDSSYAVSEDKSPNIHTRQEEGARTSR